MDIKNLTAPCMCCYILPCETLMSAKQAHSSGGHTGGASGAVHQGPRPLGAHQRGPDSNFLEKLISSVSHVASHSGYTERSFSKLKLIKRIFET